MEMWRGITTPFLSPFFFPPFQKNNKTEKKHKQKGKPHCPPIRKSPRPVFNKRPRDTNAPTGTTTTARAGLGLGLAPYIQPLPSAR
ncbi:hypothetical protein I7I50_04646 [Histoplasma capsulatum G186AR]|uniref:Uncharacterized protein n=1 Tax=Ajellomyces capsulatus TaxID=5037 RepID=A0A8H7YQY6_AJECA|nr:hypothetical protein I7I52_05555 [Histoplasma capsulatum]QSS75496.1 hypothetical protein I7I50_04646 [Histoplasma capsulatum G186AR]